MSNKAKDHADGRSELLHVSPDKLVADESWNLRQDYGDIEELAASISQVGVQVPLTAIHKDGQFVVTDGHRRYRAIRKCVDEWQTDLKTVPIMLESRYANDADRILSQITRNSGKPLSTLEKANVVKRLIELGMERAEIASKIGASQSNIGQLLTIVAAPQSVQTAINTGEIAASTVAQIARDVDHDEDKIKERVNQAISSAQSEGKKKATAKEAKNQSDKPSKKQLEQELEEVKQRESDLKDCLKTLFQSGSQGMAWDEVQEFLESNYPGLLSTEDEPQLAEAA